MPEFNNPWKSGAIFDCLDDADSCVLTCCCPCFVYAEIRSILHGGRASNINAEGIDPCLVYCVVMTMSACTLQCLYAYTTRTDIRRKYNLIEQPCDDCSTHICCHLCALCQEYRELHKYPMTAWPAPAVPGPNPGFSHPMQQPQIQQIPLGPVYSTSPQGYQSTADGYASSVASYPLSYANYPPNATTSSQYAPSAYSGQAPSVHSSNQAQSYPVPPPQQMRPPQPLVYDMHGMHQGQIRMNSPIHGTPALVYQVPRYPANNNNHNNNNKQPPLSPS